MILAPTEQMTNDRNFLGHFLLKNERIYFLHIEKIINYFNIDEYNFTSIDKNEDGIVNGSLKE